MNNKLEQGSAWKFRVVQKRATSRRSIEQHQRQDKIKRMTYAKRWLITWKMMLSTKAESKEKEEDYILEEESSSNEKKK